MQLLTHRSRPCRRLRVLASAGLALLFLLPATARGQTGSEGDEGPTYPVSSVTIRYLRENEMHPPIEAAMQAPITLGRVETGWVAPRDGVELTTMTIGDLTRGGPQPFHASAIQHLLETIRDYYVSQDLLGVYAAPDLSDINEIGQDLHPAGDADLTVVVTTGVVSELRTIGAGARVGPGREITPEERINNPAHARIRERSPIQPYEEGDEERRDLLRKGDLDRFLFNLGRHPGRRVDASVGAAGEVGGVALDYLVTENRPFVLYAQVSNTGTGSTETVRERFGFYHTQLTGNDDVLSLDYSTAGFDEVHALTASYEAPWGDNDRLRWRIVGTWDEYTASEVGFFADVFKGDSWGIGAELIANVYQDRELFVDIAGGVRFDHQHVDNQLFLIEGQEDMLLPYVGVRAERSSEWFNTQAELTLEFLLPDATGVDVNELTRLGRTNPDRDWAVLRWTASHSVFLEPLLDREAWEDPTTPESSTLAHELLFAFRGQYAFDRRLIPQSEQTVGGLYTVRGYPQSVIAGDTALIASFEYRYHWPRDFAIQPEPKEMFGSTFRTAPQYVYGTPDWDLVLKGFVDVARVIISDPLPLESDETLIGAGVGVEFLYRRNLTLRLDWGFALDDLQNRVNSGSNRLHAVATFLY